MGIDSEWHTLLSDSEAGGAYGCYPHPCVLHLYRRLVAEVYLKFVFRAQWQASCCCKACVAHLESRGVEVWLILIFATEYAMNLWHILLLRVCQALLLRHAVIVFLKLCNLLFEHGEALLYGLCFRHRAIH